MAALTTSFTPADISTLTITLITIIGIVIKLYRKVDTNTTIMRMHKEDIEEIKAKQERLDDKIDEKVKELYANSNLKYAEIFKEISFMRAEVRRLPFEIVKLLKDSNK